MSISRLLSQGGSEVTKYVTVEGDIWFDVNWSSRSVYCFSSLYQLDIIVNLCIRKKSENQRVRSLILMFMKYQKARLDPNYF